MKTDFTCFHSYVESGSILFILMLYIIKTEGGNLGKGMGPPGVRRENNGG